MKNTLLALLLVFLVSPCIMSQNSNSQSIVRDLDIERYMGVWYEIARFPHSFEKKLQGVTATYTPIDGKYIRVLNQGYKNSLDGKLKKAKGRAYMPDKDTPGHLKVSFFLCFYADYFVMELDETNYSYALVGSSSMNFLWVLSRTPEMPEEIYQMLVSKAVARGYDVSRLERVQQK